MMLWHGLIKYEKDTGPSLVHVNLYVPISSAPFYQ